MRGGLGGLKKEELAVCVCDILPLFSENPGDT